MLQAIRIEKKNAIATYQKAAREIIIRTNIRGMCKVCRVFCLYLQRFMHIRALVILIISLFAGSTMVTAAETTEQADSLIRASIVVATPGQSLYSCVGHAALRLRSEQHQLDFIYSAESQDVETHITAFLTGDLMMGVRVIPTADYLAQYRQEGRAVREYTLHLPLQARQRLWQQMDQRLQQADYPYDYLAHSCAEELWQWITAAAERDSLVVTAWPEGIAEMSPKELFLREASARKNIYTIYLMGMGGDALDPDITPDMKIVTPRLLLETLRHTQAYGRPLITASPIVLVPESGKPVSTFRDWWMWLTALCGLMIAAALVVCRSRLGYRSRLVRWGQMVVWAEIIVAGTAECYLAIVSPMPGTGYNPLMWVLNPLPLLLWPWRRRWALPYVGLILVWLLTDALFLHTHLDSTTLMLLSTPLLIPPLGGRT